MWVTLTWVNGKTNLHGEFDRCWKFWQVAYRYTLAVFQTTDIIPDNLLVTEGRPSVGLAFLQEIFQRSADGSLEEKLSSDAVIELDGKFLVLETLDEVCGLPISCVLCVVSIKVADAVRSLVITAPSQILLNGRVTGSVLLLRHDRLFRHDGVFAGLSRRTKQVEKLSLSVHGRRGASSGFDGKWNESVGGRGSRENGDESWVEDLHFKVGSCTRFSFLLLMKTFVFFQSICRMKRGSLRSGSAIIVRDVRSENESSFIVEIFWHVSTVCLPVRSLFRTILVTLQRWPSGDDRWPMGMRDWLYDCIFHLPI